LSERKSLIGSARPGEIATVVLWSWFLPGAGHWILGQRRRGKFFGAAVIGIFALGEILGNLHHVSLVDHWLAFLGQILVGLPTILCLLLFPALAPAEYIHDPRLVELGLILTVIAGALNVLITADAYHLGAVGQGDHE